MKHSQPTALIGMMALAALLLLVTIPASGIAAQEIAPTPTPIPLVVRIEAAVPQIAPGDSVTVSVHIENAATLYGLQVQCAVDPTLLTGQSRLDGDIFSGATSFFVDPGYQPNGTWLVAATRLQPHPAFSGNGTAFSLQYRALAAGTATLSCTALAADLQTQIIPLQLLTGSLSIVGPTVEPTLPPPTETPIPTQEPPTETPTATPTEPVEVTPEPTAEPPVETPTATPTEPLPGSGVIQGVARYQSAVDPSGIGVQLVADGSLVTQVITGSDGVYRFEAVAPGTYIVLVSAAQHLALVYTVTVTDAAPLDLGTGILPAGDTDDSQTIDLADAVLVGSNFDLSIPPAPAAADLNRDGVINIMDLVLVGGNFNLTGPIAQP
jgi:hypothetical protein